jgi:hypothetical protein
MNNPIRFLLFLVFSFFAFEFFQDSYRDFKVKREGEKVAAIIDGVPECGNSSTVRVLINSRPYQLRVAKVDCIKGRYVRGESVEVVYNKIFDAAVMPNANVKLALGLSIAFFIVPLWLFFSLISPTRKSVRK